MVPHRKYDIKGTLWGLGKLTNQTQTTKNDAQNGFIDYAFLGVANWAALGKSSFYGGFGLEFTPAVLQDKEFFVSKLNTGYQWQKMPLHDRFSDLSTLRQIVLNVANRANGSLSAEFLIRRKIKIEPVVTLKAIHCPSDKIQELRENIPEEFRTMIQSSHQPASNNHPSIYLKYSGFTVSDQEELIGPERIMFDGIYLYVFKENSSSCLTLKFDRETGKVRDAANDEVVGRVA